MSHSLHRRRFLAYFTHAGLATTLFPGALWALAEKQQRVTPQMIAEAARLAGLDFTDEQKQMMLTDLEERLERYTAIHNLHLPNSVAPAIEFDPVLPSMKFDTQRRPMRLSRATKSGAPKNIEEVAFWSLRDLAELVRTRRVSSVALTEMYLERLKRYDPVLKFVITLTEDRARAQAREADVEIGRGKYRGPLHGLPWGAKDLLAVKGYPTTWGAGGFEKQVVDEDAEVVKRLDSAGAVLVAKLTLGALAMGDVWYGGTTKNPWKLDQGSSGSSAGPASATAAGCVAFSIGSETLGSISSPSTRCGATGLRPTFGRVPRTGAMALSWTMDKLGPICRSVEDCAIVLAGIAGPDGRDRTVRDIPVNWDATLDPRALRIGYLQTEFEREAPKEEKPEARERRLEALKFDDDALEVLTKKLGLKLMPVKLPELPYQAMLLTLSAEAAAAFDELTRSGRDKLLTAQGPNDWPNTFRAARLIPAVEYVNANRARMLAVEQMAKVFADIDVIVTPTVSSQLIATNLTGHPAIILPNGFRKDGTPTSLTFIGQLYGEAKLCSVARAYEQATEWHARVPEKFAHSVAV